LALKYESTSEQETFMNAMKMFPILAIILALIPLSLSGCQTRADGEQPAHEHPKEGTHEHAEHMVVVTTPKVEDVVLTEEYVCQIHSRRHIEIRALVGGYLEEVHIKEGQRVQQGDLMFKILPVLYEAELNAKQAEVNAANVELTQSKKLHEKSFVSDVDVALHQAKLANAQAQANLAEAELKFTNIKAPFDGIVDHLYEFQGSLIEEGDILTTLSDNSVMWVYFNVPEARYLEYMAGLNKDQGTEKVAEGSPVADADHADDHADDHNGDASDPTDAGQHLGPASEDIDLVLANGMKVHQTGKIGAIEAQFNNETGNIHFRADFPNPSGLLRHGQTGTVQLHRTLHDAMVIPQRAVFDILDKRYVFVVNEDNVVKLREVVVQHELEDRFVVKSGLEAGEKVIFEGIRQVRDGVKVEYEFRAPEEIFNNLKYHAE
jgi:membrane fusion protein (multidrug efflux system)